MKLHIPRSNKELVIEGVMLLKLSIFVGLLASYFLPTTYAAMVGGVVNLLWLYKL